MPLIDLSAGFDVKAVRTHDAKVSLPEGEKGGALRVAFGGRAKRPSITFSLPQGRWDLSRHVAVAMDVTNRGEGRVAVICELVDSGWINSIVFVEPGDTETFEVILKRRGPPTRLAKHFADMRGLPGGYLWHWDPGNPGAVKGLSVIAVGRASGRTIEIRNVRAQGRYAALTETELTRGFFPFVDVYGQYKHKDWPGKIHAVSDFAARRTKEALDLGGHPGPAGWNRYGGWLGGPKLKATGHFRVEKREGNWWLVDPEGRLFWSHGIDCVRLGTSTRVGDRAHYFEGLPRGKQKSHDFGIANLRAKYGVAWQSKATELIHRRLRSWGINTIANWSDRKICLERKTPYVVAVHYGAPKLRGSRFPDVFRPEFRSGLRRRLTDEKETTARDPWCIGYFVDNELRWPGRDLAKVAETYYRVCREEVKAAAPDKLYLGSRLDFHYFPEDGPRVVVRAAAKYCDVVSFNRYRFTVSDFRLPEGIDKPVIIGEFHFGALDRGMLHTGLRSVADQEARASAYANYVSEALAHPAIVGTHWFQYRDQVVTGRGDGENYQIGFVDICDTPYGETITACREVGYGLYEYRMHGSRRGAPGADILRQGYGRPPQLPGGVSAPDRESGAYLRRERGRRVVRRLVGPRREVLTVVGQEQFFRLFLRVLGVSGLLAVFAIVMPYSWMDAIHSRLGMGQMPDEPIVGYLARSASALYALLGGLLLVLSFDVRRHRTVLCYLGAAVLVLGCALVFVDLLEGMPLFWTLGEGLGNAVLGTVILTMSYRLRPPSE